MTADLLKRLESGSGADRELDLAIATTLFPEAGPCTPLCEGDEPIFWHAPLYKQTCPAYTSSLDAALSLVERMLPGWGWTVYSSTPKLAARAVLVQPEYRQQVGQHHECPRRALLIALLRALGPGIYASLTEEQKAAALSYDGRVIGGDRKLPRALEDHP